jgi:hypothetical protein
MSTLHKEILIEATAEQVWDAARDVGALHTRLVPGFVTAVEMEPGRDPPVRVVTFGNGAVLREVIVDVDDIERRVVWTVESDQVRHHNGALQVFPAGPGRTRAVWIADVLPKEMADVYSPAMEQGLQAMKRSFESRPG